MLTSDKKLMTTREKKHGHSMVHTDSFSYPPAGHGRRGVCERRFLSLRLVQRDVRELRPPAESQTPMPLRWPSHTHLHSASYAARLTPS